MASSGYATESTAALVQVGFKIIKKEIIEIHCDPLNEASAGVAKKLGFKYDGIIRSGPLDHNKELRPTMIWSLLDKEFKDSKAFEYNFKMYDVVGNEIKLE